MAWNGSGSFSRTNGTYTGTTVWQQDAAALVDIEADRHDTHDQDLAAGINACLAKNGENAMTGDLDMGSNSIANADGATFSGTVTAGAVTVSSTDGGAAVGPDLALFRNSATPAAGDLIGRVIWYGEDSSSAQVAYATMYATIVDPTNGSADGSLVIQTRVADTIGTRVTISDDVTLAAAAVFSNTATFNSASTFNSTVTVASTDAGAGAGPDLVLYRNSASPVASDGLGQIQFNGEDSAGNTETYARIVGNIEDPTSTSEDGSIVFQTDVAGTLATRFKIAQGVTVGSPTGGDKGIGTVNATAVYDDNTLLTDYVMDAAVTGSIDVAAYDAVVPNRERRVTRPGPGGRPQEDVEVEIRTHEPARRFSTRLDDLDPKAYGGKWKANRRLPAFDHKAGEQLSVGEYAQRLLETCEVQAVHIDKLLERIEALEARLNNGRPN